MRVLYLYGVGFLLEAVIFIFMFVCCCCCCCFVLVYGFVVGFLVVDFDKMSVWWGGMGGCNGCH